jgi:Sensors of blue-light using FAD
MGLLYFLYASTPMLGELDVERELAELVSLSTASNKDKNLTGALIYTEKYFVQFLEGDSLSIDKLMAKVVIDTRHKDIILMARGVPSSRIFESFSLVYFGTSVFVTRKIARALAQSARGQEPKVDDLIRLMSEFSRR